MRILLWDIDGTLISSGGAGVRALGQAVRASLPAVAALNRMKVGGMTDRRIARILCAANRHREQPEVALEQHEQAVTAEEIDRLLNAYLEVLRAASPAEVAGYKVHDGVWDVLNALGPDRALHALGTGNIEGGAKAKLERVGLWERFAFGGFGSDAEERAGVLRAAWRKAEQHLGRKCEAAEFVVIGDTPRDIAAAQRPGSAAWRSPAAVTRCTSWSSPEQTSHCRRWRSLTPPPASWPSRGHSQTSPSLVGQAVVGFRSRQALERDRKTGAFTVGRCLGPRVVWCLLGRTGKAVAPESFTTSAGAASGRAAGAMLLPPSAEPSGS
jgi:phosphoglycolate phosphatase-like HAD superfamily hydrolase